MDGILFRPYLINKIVAGEKDVTRRLLNPQPESDTILEEMSKTTVEGWQTLGRSYKWWDGNDDSKIWVPRYHVGQVLFIREAHYAFGCYEMLDHKVKSGRYAVRFSRTGNITYFMDNAPKDLMTATMGSDAICDVDMYYKRSPLFLEAKHARYFIQITNIREECLQDITPEEAVREGCGDLGIIPANTAMLITGTSNLEDCAKVLTVVQFSSLWDSINPNRPFASNPHVFPIDFKYLKDYKYQITK